MDDLMMLLRRSRHQREDVVIAVLLSSSNIGSALVHSGRAMHVHSLAAERELRALIPYNISRFVNMASDAGSLTNFVSSHCGRDVETLPVIYGLHITQAVVLPQTRSFVCKILRQYCSELELLPTSIRLAPKMVVNASAVLEQPLTAPATSVISWTDVQSIRVRVAPTINTTLFADEKTYFMIGLTGDVGLSLCKWMTDRGAKYLAIASRKPNVPQTRKGTEDAPMMFAEDAGRGRRVRSDPLHSCVIL